MGAVVKLAFLLCLWAVARGQSEVQEADAPPNRQLLFVAELCRHGDRAPLYEYPSDTLPASKWPEGVGQLTAIGIRAHYELGKRLRERYVDTGFLPKSYTSADIYIRSSDVDRTLMSAVSQVTGLYPPGTAANDDVRVRFGKDPLHENEGGLPHLFQPVPVHTESRDTDALLLPGNFCPRHDVIMKHKRNSPEIRDMTEMNRHFLEQLGKISGMSGPLPIFEVDHIADTWKCYAAHSVPLPKGVTPDIVGKANNISDWLLTFGNQGVEVNRLRAGLLLHEINTYMAASALREQKRLPPKYKEMPKKFVLFSAHDTTIAATLAAMKVFDHTYPPYNSTLIWELYKSDDGEFSVRVEYNGEALILPGCSNEFCPAFEYIESVDDAVVEGPEMRYIECLTGWRRFAMSTYHYFTKKKDEDVLSPFGSPGSDEGLSAGNAVIPSLLMLCVAIVGIIGAVHIRSRYKGYSRAMTSDTPRDEYGLLSSRETTTDRRILM